MSDIKQEWYEILLKQAIQEDRERIIKIIKEKGLHLGYANDIINIIRDSSIDKSSIQIVDFKGKSVNF